MISAAASTAGRLHGRRRSRSIFTEHVKVVLESILQEIGLRPLASQADCGIGALQGRADDRFPILGFDVEMFRERDEPGDFLETLDHQAEVRRSEFCESLHLAEELEDLRIGFREQCEVCLQAPGRVEALGVQPEREVFQLVRVALGEALVEVGQDSCADCRREAFRVGKHLPDIAEECRSLCRRRHIDEAAEQLLRGPRRRIDDGVVEEAVLAEGIHGAAVLPGTGEVGGGKHFHGVLQLLLDERHQEGMRVRVAQKSIHDRDPVFRLLAREETSVVRGAPSLVEMDDVGGLHGKHGVFRHGQCW